MEFWKSWQKENKKWKQNRKKKGILKQAFSGEQIEKKNSKTAGNNLLGPFYKTKTQKHKNTKKTTKPQKTKNWPNRHFFEFWQRAPLFGKFCLFFKLHSFMSAKLCLAENTIKVVLSAEHSF